MASWMDSHASDNSFFASDLPNDEGAWGFETLEGGDQDWNWFAGLEASNAPPPQPNASREAQLPSDRIRSPSLPVHGGYATWIAGHNTASARDSSSRLPSNAAAASSSSNIGLSSTSFAPSHRQPRGTPPLTSASDSRQPAPNHSIDWLDPTEARRPARQPYIPSTYNLLEPNSPSAASQEDLDDTDYSVGIDELFAEEEVNTMPAVTRRNQRQQHRASIVDLTNDPSSPPRPTRKRSRDEGAQAGTFNKRSRRDSNNAASPKVEELDLTNEAPSAEEELLQTQQAAAIAAQQSEVASDKPLRVGQRTCIICMEPYTNATITACGHIYCHECLTQALIAGEKNSERGVGNCPVCRKPVYRKKDKNMIPVAFMKKSAFKGKRPVAV